MLRGVNQKHLYGCGAACLAFMAGKDYGRVVKDLGIKKAVIKGFYCNELVIMLEQYGIKANYKYLKPRLKKRIYTEKTIVFIHRSKRYPYGHYLVRHKRLWMDPWINFSQNKDLAQARSGFRKCLPGKPIYVIFTGSIS